MTSRDLDYAPLSRRVGLAERLRGAAGDNRTLVGMTVLSLVTLAFGFASFVATAAGELLSGGGLAVSVFFLVCLASWVGEVRAAGKDGRLARFARANGLELVVGESAEHYAGSRFADGSHIVRMSVRTRGRSFVEIGERWPVTAPRLSVNAGTDRVSAEARTPELFVRARLDGRLRAGTTVQDLVDAELDADLTELAGRCAIELSGQEVTVFGSRRLDPERPGRMREAFGLADRLAEAMEVRRAKARTEASTLSGVPVPEPGPREVVPEGQKLSPAAVVILTVTLLIAIPLLIAVVMSSLEDGLRGRREAAGLVVTLMIAAVAALVAGFVRLVTRRRPRNALVSRVVVWVGGIVAAVVVAVVAVTVVA